MSIQVICQICGKTFTVSDGRANAKTCSIQCRGKLSSFTLRNQVEVTCIICGKNL